MAETRELGVFISGERAGYLAMSGDDRLSFSYDTAYTGPDLSVAMPFASATYSGRLVRAWFDNLLPDEGSVRRGMADQEGVNAGVFPLLSRFGLDLPGAVQVVAEDSLDMLLGDRPAAYSTLTEAQVGSRLQTILKAEEERRAHSWALQGERWSLGGMQAKIALREFGGEWGECIGSAASNVIVKPGVWGLQSQALDECVTMRLAKLCGLRVADVRIHDFGGQSAIVVERYDRITSQDSGKVFRIHQEDLCQASGTVSTKKYTTDGGPSAVTVMHALEGARRNSKNRFIDALLFNYLTASTDAHAKNYSILHPRRGEFMLAPLYDLASAAPYMKAHEIYRAAMSIGGENRIGWLRKSSLSNFARMNGLDIAALTARTDELAELVIENLEPAVNDFSACSGIDELAERLIPRVRYICRGAQRNIRVDSKQFREYNPSRIAVG